MNRVHMLVLLVSPLVASCSLLLTVETWCVTNETEAADTGFPIGSHIERQGGKWRLATPPGESGNPCADYTPRKNDGGAHARVDGGDVDADVNGGDAGSTTLPDASIDGGGCMCSGETRSARTLEPACNALTVRTAPIGIPVRSIDVA